MKDLKYAAASALGTIMAISIVAIPVLAWMTHVITTIKTASWVLLVMGSVIFPIGVIHGIAIWFGVL